MGKIFNVEVLKDCKTVNLSDANEKDGTIYIPQNAAELTILGGAIEVEDEIKK